MATVFKVHMLAFGKPGEIREVTLEEDCGGYMALEEIFKYGQNDVQPQQHPSVSAGDVIEYEGEKHLIKAVGFRQLSEDEFASYVALERRDRHFSSLFWDM